MSQSPVPLLDERPASLATAWEEPLPVDGHGVDRLARSVYEFPLLGGRVGALHCYGRSEAPLATFASVVDTTTDPPRVFLDPELYAVWDRCGLLRPGHLYLPIDPADAARIRGTYQALATTPTLLDQYWLFTHLIRDRRDGERELRIASRLHRDIDDEHEIFERLPGGQLLQPLDAPSWDDVLAFETAEEEVKRKERERVRRAEWERQKEERAARGEPELDDELPF